MSRPPDQDPHCEIVDGLESLRALEPEWRQLFGQTPGAYAAAGFDWCRCCAETLAEPSGHSVLCVAIRESGRPVLLWPWVLGRRKRLWREAIPLGGWISGFSLPLVAGDAHGAGRIRLALQAIGKRSDLIRIPRVPEDSLLWSTVGTLGGVETIHVLRSSEVRFDGHPDWEHYHLGRDATERRDLRRRRRRLIEAGTVTVEPLLETSRCPEAIDWILGHKRAWARARNRTDLHLHTEAYRQLMMRAATARRSEEGTVVATLALNGRIIAGVISQVDRTRIGFMVSTYDPGYARFAPGQLLYEDLIRWACDRRLTAEFRIGSEAYKEAWVNRHGICRTVLAPSSASGRSYFRFKFLYRRLVRKG